MIRLEPPTHSLPPPATVARRLGAFAVDYLLISLYIGLLVLASLTLGPEVGSEALFADPLRGQLASAALLTLPVVLYFALMESSSRGATVGKRVVGIQVRASKGPAAGRRLPLARSLVRSALKFAPWEIAHTSLWRLPGWPGEVETVPWGVALGFALTWVLGGLYLAFPLLSRRRQTPYDRAAGSVVVRTPVTDPAPGRRPA